MNQNSKSSRNSEVSDTKIDHLLNQRVDTGRELVKLSREIIHAYSAMGLSIDDNEIEEIIGIESETDDMNLDSNNNNEDYLHVYRLYKEHFEDSRKKIHKKLVKLRKNKYK